MLNNPLKNLIGEGEGQNLDFKYNINSAPKIAKSLVAFANADGGVLLVGVKDNGRIVGVATDEELFMIELAAESFCAPQVNYSIEKIKVEDKVVLKVMVPSGNNKPYFAIDEQNRKQAYMRLKDENIAIDRTLVAWLKRQHTNGKTLIRYQKEEQLLFSLIERKKNITLKDFYKEAHIPPSLAEKIMLNLCSVGLLMIRLTDEGTVFSDKEG